MVLPRAEVEACSGVGYNGRPAVKYEGCSAPQLAIVPDDQPRYKGLRFTLSPVIRVYNKDLMCGSEACIDTDVWK